jgi:hypothetical protein
MNSSGRKTGATRSVYDPAQWFESRLGTNEEKSHAYEDTDTLIQGLTPEQIQILAQKVYDMLLDELRIEAERLGRPR